MQSKYTNTTDFMPLNDFVRPNVYDCHWTLFIFSVLLLSTDQYLQDSKKNERKARSHSRKGPRVRSSRSVHHLAIDQYLMSSQHSNKALGKMVDLRRTSTHRSLVLNFGREIHYTL